MSPSKHGIAGWLLVLAIAAGSTAPIQGQDRGPRRQEVVGIFKAADAAAITITVLVGEGRREGGEAPAAKEETYPLAKNVEVAVAASGSFGGVGRGGGAVVFKEIKLSELSPGVRVGLTLSADQKSVESIVAEGPMMRGRLQAVDAAKGTVTIALPPQGERGRGEPAPAGEEKTFTVAPDAEIAADDGRGSRFSVKEAKLTDLAQGALVTARLSVNLKQVQLIMAEGPMHQGTVKAIDADKKSLTLVVRSPRGEDAGEEHALVVSTDAVILLDDGKGRRLSLKQAKLADVPVGATATVKLSADQSFVMLLRAEGPMLSGQLKAVDPDKGTLVLAVPKGRGEDPEEKPLTVAKDALIFVDGAEATLANLKVGENAPPVQLRLSLDQRTVQSVIARQSGRDRD